ncbi:DUF2637 domain-containing protein [Nocardiopsis nanhaiensis]
MNRGTLVAWLAFTTGAVVSIGANVLHALDNDGPTDLGRLIAAGWAPVALLLVAELVTRARQSGPWWIITLRWLGTAVVAGVAAIVSYGHMRDLLLSYGETALVAHLLPLSVDGLLLVSSLALASPAEKGPHNLGTPAAPAEKGGHVVPPPAAPAEGGERIGPPADPVEGERFVTHAAPVPVPAASGTNDTVTVPLNDAQALDVDTAEEPGDEREQARQAYRAALAQGVPLTGRQLAERFGRSASWGRTRIRECQSG